MKAKCLALKIERVARTIDPPLTPAFGQYADDLRVVGGAHGADQRARRGHALDYKSY